LPAAIQTALHEEALLDCLRRSKPLCITQRPCNRFAVAAFLFGSVPGKLDCLRRSNAALHYPKARAPSALRFLHLSAFANKFATLLNAKTPSIRWGPLLPDLDSNQDKLNQNQLYCHYTIGQPFIPLERSAKVRASVLFPK
jgi:hypothetical protein